MGYSCIYLLFSWWLCLKRWKPILNSDKKVDRHSIWIQYIASGLLTFGSYCVIFMRTLAFLVPNLASAAFITFLWSILAQLLQFNKGINCWRQDGICFSGCRSEWRFALVPVFLEPYQSAQSQQTLIKLRSAGSGKTEQERDWCPLYQLLKKNTDWSNMKIEFACQCFRAIIVSRFERVPLSGGRSCSVDMAQIQSTLTLFRHTKRCVA